MVESLRQSLPAALAKAAEGVGFEPTMRFDPIAVFKTAAIGL
jgi:hypothetical protein